ncbi:MAG: diaminopimelate epimerase [Pseudomonadota bacterium]
MSKLSNMRSSIDLHFTKANSFGNNFIIYDQSRSQVLTDFQLRELSGQVTDQNFGIGADNLLVVEKCNNDTLLRINAESQYWNELPQTEANYIFRMFEPDGEEALCCGNGLVCVANYLMNSQGVAQTKILTEIPLDSPKCTSIGSKKYDTSSWVNLGRPRSLPNEIKVYGSERKSLGDLQWMQNMKIRFREHDLQPYSTKTELDLSGYLIFTGEPHLVFVIDENSSLPIELSDAIFANSTSVLGAGPIFRRRKNTGTWLVEHIGRYLNREYKSIFPIGINVNFVRKNPERGVIEYRCYERGINKETLACGTGAVAVAYTAKKHFGEQDSEFRVWPHRCRWYKPDAEILVTESEEGWTFSGQPRQVAEGKLTFDWFKDLDKIPNRCAAVV